ncbi:MAG: prephenate dehydrogenase/arogenate dehydrogenase family protein [Deltaproteobacteria bacterium]|nr:prephenate dehydrogenase/arogenate dehydrogenase family protein [Deltaproteobacteria bacterium]
MKPEFIGIIGGLGRMGSLMSRLFTEAGYRVLIADIKAGPVSWEPLLRCEVILLAVPIPAMEEVLREIGPRTRPEGVVIDIGSLKEGPIKSMLEHCRGEVIGSHPLFGPSVSSLEEQIFFVCPARAERWQGWFCSFLQDRGARVVEIEPQKHDWLMARVQILRHLLLLTFGLSLRRLEFEVAAQLPLSGPWFSQLVGMLSKQLEQAPDLSADLASHNLAAKKVYDSFFKAAQEVADKFSSQDRQGIIDLIKRVSFHLGDLIKGSPSQTEARLFRAGLGSQEEGS